MTAILSLLGATLQGWPGAGEHLTLNVPTSRFAQNGLRIPTTETVGAVIDWARLLNDASTR